MGFVYSWGLKMGAKRVKIGKTGQAAEKKDLNGPNRAVCRRRCAKGVKLCALPTGVMRKHLFKADE